MPAMLQSLTSDALLLVHGGNVQPSNETFVIFQHVKRVAHRRVVFHCHAAAQGVGIEETLDQFERASIIPMQFLTPMAGLLQKEGLQLSNSRLAKVDNVHE